MKYRLILAMTLLSFCQSAMADASATWTCTGDKVVLKSITPYLGENSTHTQTLFILSKAPTREYENVDTAFFLDVEHDMGKFGMLYITGKNEVGGKFQVIMNAPQDIGDGTTIKMEAKGRITYKHGPTLTGLNEAVSCILE